MSKRNSLPQSRRHIFVYDEDWDFLVENYGPGAEKAMGVSTAIRTIIHAKVLGLKALANQRYDKIREELRKAGGDPEADGKVRGDKP